MNDPVPSSDSRSDGRAPDQLRDITFQNGIAPHATGSTLVAWGDTRVICGVTVEESIPRWMRDQENPSGWITAEYSMLPYSTLSRKPRDSSRGRVDGRSTEIQRLIGRSLRSAIDLGRLGPRTLWVDCDVLQADGGTRTAAITGAWVALALAIQKLMSEGKLEESPLLPAIAAVSVGIVKGTPVLDLCYVEDVDAEVDMNVVMNAESKFIEVQGTGEEAVFSRDELNAMLDLAESGVRTLLTLQQQAVS